VECHKTCFKIFTVQSSVTAVSSDFRHSVENLRRVALAITPGPAVAYRRVHLCSTNIRSFLFVETFADHEQCVLNMKTCPLNKKKLSYCLETMHFFVPYLFSTAVMTNTNARHLRPMNRLIYYANSEYSSSK